MANSMEGFVIVVVSVLYDSANSLLEMDPKD